MLWSSGLVPRYMVLHTVLREAQRPRETHCHGSALDRQPHEGPGHFPIHSLTPHNRKVGDRLSPHRQGMEK